MRLKYTEKEEKKLRITEIMATLENKLYESPAEEKELLKELSALQYGK